MNCFTRCTSNILKVNKRKLAGKSSLDISVIFSVCKELKST